MDEATEAASRDLRRHYREIYRYVRRRSRTASDAEDVTQDVFADAARALGGEAAEGLPMHGCTPWPSADSSTAGG